jgi:hypothetical protein
VSSFEIYLKGRSSKIAKKIFGAAFVGNWVFLPDSRNGNRGSNKRIYIENQTDESNETFKIVEDAWALKSLSVRVFNWL